MTVMATTSTEHPTLIERIKYFSDWHRAKVVIAICLLFIERMKYRVKKGSDPSLKNGRKQLDTPSKGVMVRVKDLQRVELLLIKADQSHAFPQKN